MLFQDLRDALRAMRKYPFACVVAILSLAVGIGATTATLTVRNHVFRNPPPVSPDPEQLVEIFMPTPERSYRAPVPAGLLTLWTQQTRVLAGLAGAKPAVETTVRSSDTMTNATVRAVTPNIFSLLGVAAVLGSTSLDPLTAVVSHRYWQRVLHGRPDVVGSTLWINDQPHTIVGVLPERFWVFDMQTQIWTPLDVKTFPSATLLEVIARRKRDVSLRTAATALEGDLAQYTSTLPDQEKRARIQVVQMQGTPLGHAIAPAVVWLVAACVVLTLLIACTNVAVLVIAQWTGREREISIRAALGASRRRIVRALLTESVLLAVAAAVLGVAATFAALRIMLRQAPADIELFNLAIDAGVLIRITAVALSAGILTGLAPALYETRRLQANPLRAIPSERVRQRWRSALVVTEITITIALLVVTSTMIDGYHRAVSADLGFNTRLLLAASVEAPRGVRLPEVRDHLRGLPGVAGVAASTTPAMGRPSARRTVALNGAGANSMMADRSVISSEFFNVIGVSIRAGRGFAANEDGQDAAPVAIVNEALVDRMWPGKNPIGMELWTEGRCYDVVGVVNNYRNVPLSVIAPAFFLPVSSATEELTHLTFYIRSTGSPAELVQPVRADIRNVAADHVVSSVFTLDSIIEIIGREILTAVYPMTPLIATGLLLTAAGIYGVLSFAIARRSKELAVRVAVGATALQLLTLIAGLSLRLSGLGILFGIGTTFALSRFIQGEGGVFDSPNLTVFVVPMFILLTLGALATWVPSRLALSINPASLLRME